MGGHPMHTYCAEVQGLLMCLVLSAKLPVCELYQGVTGSMSASHATVLSSCDTILVCIVVMLSA
jgi:hypothetical protein